MKRISIFSLIISAVISTYGLNAQTLNIDEMAGGVYLKNSYGAIIGSEGITVSRTGGTFRVYFKGYRSTVTTKASIMAILQDRMARTTAATSNWQLVDISVPSKTNGDYPDFEGYLEFYKPSNGSAHSPCFFVCTGNQYVKIIQEGVNGQINNNNYYLVTASKKWAFSGEGITLTLHGSDRGAQYSLNRRAVGATSWLPVTTKTGTGSAMEFSVQSGWEYLVGTVETGPMINEPVVKTYWPFTDSRNAYVEPVTYIDPDGGSSGFWLYYNGPELLYNDNHMALTEMMERINTEWTTHMKLQHHSTKQHNILLVCGPNLGTEREQLGLELDGIDALFYQMPGGRIRQVNVEYVESRNKIVINDPQDRIKYRLYNHGELVGEVEKTDYQYGYEVGFDNIGQGFYTMQAFYKDVLYDMDWFRLVDEEFLNGPEVFTDRSMVRLDPNGIPTTVECTYTCGFVNLEHHLKYVFNHNETDIAIRVASHDPSTRKVILTVVASPNLGTTVRSFDSSFIYVGDSGQTLRFEQDGGGEILYVDFEGYPDYPSFSRNKIHLPFSQLNVSYRLSPDYQYPHILKGTGGELWFEDIPKGWYEVIGGGKRMIGAAVFNEDPASVRSGGNYIFERTFTRPQPKESNPHHYSDITYYDALGYPMQYINIGASSNGKNIVNPVWYDPLLRDDHKLMLPYVYNNTSGQEDYSYLYNGERFYNKYYPDQEADSAFVKNLYDASGLNRKTHSYKPGKLFYDNDKPSQYFYDLNTSSELLLFDHNFEDNSIKAESWYPANKLFKNTTIDEDGDVTVNYVDPQGRIILERKILDQNLNADTYYVYDPYFGNLTWVLSPEASAQIVPGRVIHPLDEVAEQFCYIYKYGELNTLVEKKIPGKEKEYFIYDKDGILILSQDGKLRINNKWLLNTYDEIGRLTRTYLVEYDGNRESLQDYYRTNGLESLYSSGLLVLSNQYDSYSGVPGDMIEPQSSGKILTTKDGRVKGKITYQKMLAIRGSDVGIPEYVEKTYFYNLIGDNYITYVRNHLGGISRYFTEYDLAGNVLFEEEEHQAGSGIDILTREYAYDHRGRLLEEISSINNSIKGTVAYQYGELGELKSTRLGDNIRTNHSYNLQGWTTGSKDDYFEQDLRYFNPVKPGSIASYSRNISEWGWDHKGSDAAHIPPSTYGFDYDRLGRLTDSYHYENMETVPVKKFAEDSLNYDLNGNIRTLRRYGHENGRGDYSYTYHGNQLTGISNGTLEEYNYTYDVNGNMTYDGRLRTGLDYNYLNLIGTVKDGADGEIKAQYTWLADGTKLSVTTGDGEAGYEYLGSLVYERRNGQLALESAAFGGGRIYATTESVYAGGVSGSSARPAGNYGTGPEIPVPWEPNEPDHPDPYDPDDNGEEIVVPWEPVDPIPVDPIDPVDTDGEGETDGPSGPGESPGNGYSYQVAYFIRDHLGSVRVVVDHQGNVLSRHDYYPFGLAWPNQEMQTGLNRYLYNGKELQGMASLDYLDYCNRTYDSFSGRWLNLDPLAEKFQSAGPYIFCFANPIKYIDFDGKEPREKTKLKLSISLSGSFGPQLGASVRIGIIEGKAGFKLYNVEGTTSINYSHSKEEGSGISFDYKSRDIYAQTSATLSSPFIKAASLGSEFEKTKDTKDHPVFAEEKVTSRKGLIENVIGKDKHGRVYQDEKFSLSFGSEINFILLGVGFEIKLTEE